MTPHKQRLAHRPSQGLYGDCHRTCIACLLDVDPADVPHPYAGGMLDADEANAVIDSWLGSLYGLRQVHFAYHGEMDRQQVLDTVKHFNPGLAFILGGSSRNGVGHLVIARDGEIIHDPSQDDSGIVGPAPDGFWWVTILARAT